MKKCCQFVFTITLEKIQAELALFFIEKCVCDRAKEYTITFLTLHYISLTTEGSQYDYYLIVSVKLMLDVATQPLPTRSSLLTVCKFGPTLSKNPGFTPDRVHTLQMYMSL